MPQYLIYRHGSNAKNQIGTPVRAIAIVEAKTQQGACLVAANRHTVEANQRLEAVPRSRAKKWDWLAVDAKEWLTEESNVE